MGKKCQIRKCPKCGKIPLHYTELWKNHAIEFAIEDGGLLEGELSVGDPYKVKAECECGHYWTLRGVTQIIELLK